MDNSLQSLTDGLIIFSVLVSDFEKFDFKNDALAGVRANYFNTDNSTQNEVTEISLDGKVYKLSYLMSSDKPFSWKVSKNNRPFQSVKRATGGIYCVMYYGDNGIIYKRQYFDSQHTWIRTEYFDTAVENKLLCRIYPETIKGIIALKIENINADGTFSVKALFPSKASPRKKCDALIYSNIGMLWYDESFKPAGIDLEIDTRDESKNSFRLDLISFNPAFACDSPLDLDNAEYLDSSAAESENIKNIENEPELSQNSEQLPEEEPRVYTAYDKIEKILSEAHKTNKDLFGEVLSNVCDENGDYNFYNSAEPIPDEEADSSEEILSLSVMTDEPSASADADTEEVSEALDTKESTSYPEINADTDEAAVNAAKAEKIEYSEDFNSDECTADFEVGEEAPCDTEILTKSGCYTYYGTVDENNLRCGRGRTVAPSGLTSYDGEYRNNLKNGFGVCYYKGGEINYVGNWEENNRNGAGVGYRLSDGTMHAGKWKNNSPDGCGARFDSEGNFIDICGYNCGVRSGTGVSFDENGNVVISKWKDGEKVSESVIEAGD